MRLADIHSGQSAIIVKVLGHGAFRKRLIEMGFVRGRVVSAVLEAPLHDPIKYRVMGYEVSLRRSEAEMVEVVAENSDTETSLVTRELPGNGICTDDDDGCQVLQTDYHHSRHTINVALIGNPNCGKTSLFNDATGSREHVGNYSGVTVDARSGSLEHGGYLINVVDLPGTYSLTCYSPEEMYVRRYLRENNPDLIINVVDASNLERNLYLTTELIDMDYSMVIALNMYDELEANGAKLHYNELGAMIGVPMVPVVARTGRGIDTLLDTVVAVFEGRDTTVRHIHVSLGADLEGAIRRLVDSIKATPAVAKHFSPRYLAIKLLEGDHDIEDEMARLAAPGNNDTESEPHSWRNHIPRGANSPLLLLRDKLRGRIESIQDQDISSMVAAEKYGFIAGALAETYVPGRKKGGRTTRVLDSLATNRLLGFPIFFVLIFSMFWLTFVVGQYPMTWIDEAVVWLGNAVDSLMPDGPLHDMVVDGIIGGVGGVIVFLPNILILYFCISLMEDSGYMARAAFIMDRPMHRIGLHGKSFIPLVMGFGCNVPAILASRAIESRSSRIITVLINPFMSCSARLPVFVLITGTFFATYAPIVLIALYMTGILAAILTARMLRRFYFHRDETPFVMELPPYRMPTIRASLSHTWYKGKEYLRKMGGIILVASILVWALNYFPINHGQPGRPSDSYLEIAGKAINPIMEPIGFHWRATVAAMAGLPAKEIVVSTLGVLYLGHDVGEDDSNDKMNSRLAERLSTAAAPSEKPDFAPASALAFLTFILLYCPCTATITAICRETHSIRYALFSIVYNTLLAWLAALAVFKITSLLL